MKSSLTILTLATAALFQGVPVCLATGATDPAIIAEIAAANGSVPGSRSLAGAWVLRDDVRVDRQGVFLSSLIKGIAPEDLPVIRLGDAPAVGKTLSLSRAQIIEEVSRQLADFKAPAWAGAERTRITRRVRVMADSEFRQLLTATLQNEQVRDKGELDLTLTRGVGNPLVPDEPLELRILDMPRSGLAPTMALRCELRCGGDSVASVTAIFQARLMRDVWVARSTLVKGQSLLTADVGQEKRDVLTSREAITALPVDDGSYEVADIVQSGALLSQRSFRQRPVVRRGNVVEAMLEDGNLTISVKAEALEDGIPGQLVRVRNLRTQREFRGKVKNEQTVLVQM